MSIHTAQISAHHMHTRSTRRRKETPPSPRSGVWVDDLEPPSSMDFNTPSNATTPARDYDTLMLSKRRPMPRKGHTKSRMGCLVCKKRKVKCDEGLPHCGPCMRLSLDCVYTHSAGAEGIVTGSRAVAPLKRPLRAENVSFTMSDLRSFHHFLTIAYPSLPVDGAEIWQKVGQLSHHYDFVAHSMLALGSSHLSESEDPSFVNDSLKHRVKAIKSLNQFWQKNPPTEADSDALFASMLILCFQTGYIRDGINDHLSMTRGCYIIGHKFIRDSGSSIFNVMRDDIYSSKSTHLQSSAEDERRAIQTEKHFRSSLENIASICQPSLELDYIRSLKTLAKSALSEATESDRENSYMYERLGEFTNDEFMSFIDPTNHIARLVILHMFYLDFEMSKKAIGHDNGQAAVVGRSRISNWVHRQNMTRHWMAQIQEGLSEEYKTFGRWIVDIMGCPSYSIKQESRSPST